VNPRERVRQFVITGLKFAGDPSELTDDFRLLERGVLDSVGIFMMLEFLESEFGVEIDEEELVAEHFESIAKISQLVESKQE
jgi:acyl carrier protein